MECGHEVLAASPGQTYIVNDLLERGEIDRVTALDRFKKATLRRWMRGSGVLVDFGSASGRFLHQNSDLFRAAIGVEVTPEVARFAREVFGLDIRASVDGLPDDIDVVTCWHSLEHVPADALHGVVRGVARRLGPRGTVIVSVPNVRSLQHRLFGRKYAFYDVPNHHHQFSLRSLDLLMAGAGLARKGLARSVVYNVFGWLQGGLNVIGGRHNHLYDRLKRCSGPDRPWLTAAHLLMLPLVAATGIPFAAIEAGLVQRQGVITACYANNRS